jgi:hypothetical protein
MYVEDTDPSEGGTLWRCLWFSFKPMYFATSGRTASVCVLMFMVTWQSRSICHPLLQVYGFPVSQNISDELRLEEWFYFKSSFLFSLFTKIGLLVSAWPQLRCSSMPNLHVCGWKPSFLSVLFLHQTTIKTQKEMLRVYLLKYLSLVMFWWNQQGQFNMKIILFHITDLHFAIIYLVFFLRLIKVFLMYLLSLVLHNNKRSMKLQICRVILVILIKIST